MTNETDESTAAEKLARDPVAVLAICDDLAKGLSTIVSEQSAILLPFVLRSAFGFKGERRRKAIASLKKMLQRETFDRLVAESKRRD